MLHTESSKHQPSSRPVKNIRSRECLVVPRFSPEKYHHLFFPRLFHSCRRIVLVFVNVIHTSICLSFSTWSCAHTFAYSSHVVCLRWTKRPMVLSRNAYFPAISMYARPFQQGAPLAIWSTLSGAWSLLCPVLRGEVTLYASIGRNDVNGGWLGTARG